MLTVKPRKMILFSLFMSLTISNTNQQSVDDKAVLRAFSESFLTSKNDFLKPMTNSDLFPLSKSKTMNMKMNRTNSGAINDQVTAGNLTDKLEIWRGFSKISSKSEPVLKDVDDLISTFSKVNSSVKESFLNSSLEKDHLPLLPTRCLNLVSSSKIKIDESQVEMSDILRKYPLSIPLLYKVLILLRNSSQEKRGEVLARLNVPASLEKDLSYAVGYRWTIKTDDLPLKILLKFPADSIVNMNKESFEVLRMPIKLRDHEKYSKASLQSKVAWYSKFLEQKGWEKFFESEEDFKHHGHLLAGAPLDQLQTLINESINQSLLARLVNITDFDPSRAQILWESLDLSNQVKLFRSKAKLLDISQVVRHFEANQLSPKLYQEEFEQSLFDGRMVGTPWATVMFLGLRYMSDQDFATWTNEDVKAFGKFVKVLSPREIDQLDVDFSLDIVLDILSPSLTLSQLTSIYSKYSSQMTASPQVMEPVPSVLLPALSSAELLSSQPPFLWSADSERLLTPSATLSPGQQRALQEVTAPGRWAPVNISSILLLQPSCLSEVFPAQLKTNLERLLEGISQAGYHKFYDVARNVQMMSRHLVVAWLEAALARYQADGVLTEDFIATEVLLDQLTEDMKPDMTVNNPDHLHPLAHVFDRWTAPGKTYLTSLLLTGLSCQQIKMIRTGDFLEILAVYRYHLRTSGLSAMPSSTRKCFAKKLRDYLTFKSVVVNVTVQSETELLSMLNTAEIKTVGGEVLLTWGGPALASIVNPEVGHEVLLEVAMTRPFHLLTNGVLCTCVKQMATALLDMDIQHQQGQLDFTVLTHLHNLLPYSDSRVLDASARDLRMFVRTVLTEEEKTVCLNMKERDLMRNLILKAYGSPSQWSSLDLLELGDLLIVMRSTDLDTVSPTSLRLAASQLASQSTYSAKLTQVRNSVSGSMYYEACMDWLGSDESSESLLYWNQWKMFNEFIVVGNFLQFEVMKQGLRSVPKPRTGGLGRRKRQAEESSINYKTLYEKVIGAMKTQFDSGSLSDEQKTNATNIITTTQSMLASYSFDVLGLEKKNLTQNEILSMLGTYRESGNMTDQQTQQISKLAVDTQIRLIQELSPLLGLEAEALEISSSQYSDLMAQSTFVISEPTIEDPLPSQETSPEVTDLMAEGLSEVTTEVAAEVSAENSLEVSTEVPSAVPAEVSTAAEVPAEVPAEVSTATEAPAEVPAEVSTSAEVPTEVLAEDLSSVTTEVTKEMTTVADNLREPKIVNEGEVTTDAEIGQVDEEVVITPAVLTEVSTEQVGTEVSTNGTDLGSILSNPLLVHLATFTAYEPKTKIFETIPKLSDLVLSCDVLTAAGHSAAVLGEENIKEMDSKDLENCLVTLGRLPWTNSSLGSVWQALKSKVELFSAPEPHPIKRELMLQLHNLLPAVVRTDPDLIDVTEENIDGLSIIGKLLQDEPLSLVQRYLTTNKVNSSLSSTAAASLGQLLCGLTSSQWQSLVTAEMFPALVTDHLSALHCEVSPEVASHLSGLLLALYGPVSVWEMSDVLSAGWLTSTLPASLLSAIPPHAMEGLAPLAVKFLSPAQWTSLSPEQLSFISPHTASFISSQLLQSVAQSENKMREIRGTVGEYSRVTKQMEMMHSGRESLHCLPKLMTIQLFIFYYIVYL